MAAAYGQLVAEGWLTARPGSGTQVAPRVVVVEASSEPPAPDATRIRYDLGAGSPDLAAFPRARWLAAARQRAGRRAPSEAMGYSDPRGRPELRRELADYLSRARGVYAAPDRIVICSGFSQGLALLCQALRAAGATAVVTEAYGHRNHRDAVVASGLRFVAGLHVLVELPTGQREDDVVARARRHGLIVEGLDSYSAGGHGHNPALVVGYATPPEHAFDAAIASLCAVLQGVDAR